MTPRKPLTTPLPGPPKHEILAQFWCDVAGKPWLNSMIVIEPCKYKTGENAERHKRCRGHGSTYDVDWCKRDGLYLFHESGSAASPMKVGGIYWRTDGFAVSEIACEWCSTKYQGPRHIDAETKAIRLRNKTRRLTELPENLRFDSRYDDLLDYLQTVGPGREIESVFCCICKDDLPDDGLCKHCWWCDTVGWYVTPSSETKVCFDPDCWECRNHRRAKHEAHRAMRRQEAFNKRMEAINS
jgi:hypothetical protein